MKVHRMLLGKNILFKIIEEVALSSELSVLNFELATLNHTIDLEP